jgi:hypothetical protein
MSDENIFVEDETYEKAEEESADQTSWTEEIAVAGSELWQTVMNLAHEATVRRVVIKNEKRNIHFEVPLLAGVAGIAMLPSYAALGFIALLVTDFSIVVERSEKQPEPEVEIAID